MLELYFMRHGETLFNVRRVEQGQCDSPLTDKGIQQAEAAAAYFRNHHIVFDACYSSTLERACDTLEIITDQPYIRRHDLKEISLGTKEATPIDKEPPYPYGDYYVQFGGEDLEAFRKRIYHAVSVIAEKEYDPEKSKKVLIVSHGMAMKQFLSQISYTSQIPSNCGIAHIVYNRNGFHFMELIDPMNINDKERI